MKQLTYCQAMVGFHAVKGYQKNINCMISHLRTVQESIAIYNPYLKRWLWDADETELVENEVLAWAEKREPYRRKRCEDAKGDTEVD